MRFIIAAALCGLVFAPLATWAQSAGDGPRALKDIAAKLEEGADEVGERVLTAKGKLADALVSEQNESLYGRFEKQCERMKTAAAALDAHPSKAAFGTDPGRSEIEATYLRELRGARVLARAIQDELRGGGFPEALQIFRREVKPSLSQLERQVPAMAAALEEPTELPTTGRT